MQFALVDNKKAKARPGLDGICPGCSRAVIAKCGEQRVHHWAHSRNKMCDTWWEPETEWHRNWKNCFPEEWQETFLPDEQTGEKHMADLRTADGSVIEFQHSHINPVERRSRERFYRDLTWVIDGSRLKRDYPRFLKGRNTFKLVKKGIFRVDHPEEYFPAAWLESSALVVFDFRGTDALPEHEKTPDYLYCLFPKRIGGSAIVTEIPRKAFIDAVVNGEWLIRTTRFLNEIVQEDNKWQERLEHHRRQQENLAFQKFIGPKSPRRKWRF